MELFIKTVAQSVKEPNCLIIGVSRSKKSFGIKKRTIFSNGSSMLLYATLLDLFQDEEQHASSGTIDGVVTVVLKEAVEIEGEVRDLPVPPHKLFSTDDNGNKVLTNPEKPVVVSMRTFISFSDIDTVEALFHRYVSDIPEEFKLEEE